jgi:hypothetical protein
LFLQTGERDFVQADLCQRLFMSVPPPFILVGDRHELGHGMHPVADDAWRRTATCRNQASADDEQAIVITPERLFDDDPG